MRPMEYASIDIQQVLWKRQQLYASGSPRPFSGCRAIPQLTVRVSREPLPMDAMDAFFEEFPAFRNLYELAGRVESGSIAVEQSRFYSELAVLPVAQLLEFLKSPVGKSEAVREQLLYIAKNESEGIESLVYSIMARKNVKVADLDTMIVLYEFLGPESEFFTQLLPSDELALYSFLMDAAKYHKDISSRFTEYLSSKSPGAQMCFYLLCGKYLRPDLISNFIHTLDELPPYEHIPKYKYAILFYLPHKQCYASLASRLLYKPTAEIVAILRIIQGKYDSIDLIDSLLDESFSNSFAVGKTFVAFLHILILLGQSPTVRTKCLFSWMRFFLYHGKTRHFVSCYERLLRSRTKYPTDEMRFFDAFALYLNKKLPLQSVAQTAEDLPVENEFARHGLKEIMEKYAGSEAGRDSAA